MSCGINLEEQKRQQQYMNMQAQQQLEQKQNMNYAPKKRVKKGSHKDMIVTICLVLGMLLLMILLNGR